MKRRIAQYFEQGIWYLIRNYKRIIFFTLWILVILVVIFVFIFIFREASVKTILNLLSEPGTSIRDTVYLIGGQ